MKSYIPPKKFTTEEISSAVTLIKTERPDLWERWRQHELNNEGFSDISADLITLLIKLPITSTLIEVNALLFALRVAVRVELGLWVA